MFKHILVLALRTMRRHKLHAAINIIGLALGLACCLLILLFVVDELSFDRHHPHADRLYRVGFTGRFGNETWQTARTQAPLAPLMHAQLPEVEKTARILRLERPLLRFGEQQFYEERFYAADAGLPELFAMRFRAGSPATALAEPFSVVITQSTAEKYFGDAQAVGQILNTVGQGDFRVTAVVDDLPGNTHFRFDLLTNLETLRRLRQGELGDWGAFMYSTYVRLSPASDPGNVAEKLTAAARPHMGSDFTPGDRFFLTPITDLHLYSEASGELGTPGDMTLIYILSSMAIFVLLLACVNFMNLTAARAMQRAREVGVRKVLGSSRPALLLQFLAESLLLVIFALLAAMALTEAALPYFNALTGKMLTLMTHAGSGMLALVLGLGLLAALLAGSYPAAVLSAFGSVDAMRGARRTLQRAGVLPGRGDRLRRALVVLQFTVSIFFIIGTLAIASQLAYFRSKDLGFDKEQVLVVQTHVQHRATAYEALKHELRQYPAIVAAATSHHVPGAGNSIYQYQIEGQEQPLNMPTYFCDSDFLSAMAISLIAGRDFSAKISSDANEAFIINETAVRELGWASPEQAIGKQIMWDNTKRGRIVGVVRDFHYRPVQKAMTPLVVHMFPFDQYRARIVVRLRPDGAGIAVEHVRRVMQTFEPNYALEASFLNADFEALLENERCLQQLVLYAAVFAITIACLGLYGLAAFAAEQRTREIGIRKVLGATTVAIARLLTGEFARLVLVANVIAWPLAWLAMQQWLAGFAFRSPALTGAGVWWLFMLAGAVALAIAVLTVASLALRAAVAKPVTMLRHE